MNYILYFSFFICFNLFNSCIWNNARITKKINKDVQLQKSYMIGYKIGNNIKKLVSNSKDSKKIFYLGLKHSMDSKKSLLKADQIKQIMQSVIKDKKHSVKKRLSKKGKSAMESGKLFLEKNKTKSGVKTTDSGLQYVVVKEGTGKQPNSTDQVEVHYKGTLIDGTEFDSSYKRNKSLTFPLNGVIKGWTEGLQLMKEGAEYTFFIPSALAYGDNGTPGIPPNSVLIFKVELIKVL